MNNFDKVQCLYFIADKMGEKVDLALEIISEFNNINDELFKVLQMAKIELNYCKHFYKNEEQTIVCLANELEEIIERGY
jgi:hypothetical protein